MALTGSFTITPVDQAVAASGEHNEIKPFDMRNLAFRPIHVDSSIANTSVPTDAEQAVIDNDREFAAGIFQPTPDMVKMYLDTAPMFLQNYVRRVTAERDGWVDSAAQFHRNTEYYRGLLDQAAAHLGPDVYVQDDGGICDSPLRAKIPELVAAMAARVAEFTEFVEKLRSIVPTTTLGTTIPKG